MLSVVKANGVNDTCFICFLANSQTVYLIQIIGMVWITCNMYIIKY